ncbi:hypothetical protein GKE82_05655 [Conexibacter sp. W3-3-2]|uniref:hypothetical protein n=1 Tax=Conexibacter sp. W3-3-2 TaxID=2675227 RepID=UPI0012B8D335|nr:hypothetical protein [Conexibacter sp. W3-3-2]MTD43805.1 hypothetical protein [Conexibacter sp. W3-3-2]
MTEERSKMRIGLVNLLVVMALGMLVAPGMARAGTYDVHACNPAVAGGANNAFFPLSNAGLTAFAECPAGQGITVRNGWDNGQSSFLEGAYMVFDAPGGNVVESVHFQAGFERHDCSWGTGVVASGYDLGGTRVWGFAPGVDCGSGQTPGPTNFFPSRFDFAINQPRVRFETRCGAGICPRTGIAAFRVRDVLVRVRDDAGPALAGGRGALWTSDGWLAGSHTAGFDASDPSGIREIGISVDGKRVGTSSPPCDFTRPTPCPPASIEEPQNTSGWGGDGEHTVTLTAVDAAGNASTSSRAVKVDNNAPDAPKDVIVEGGDGWRPSNGFKIRWTNPDQTAAPIAGVNWELCTPDGKECKRGSEDKADVEALDKLELPAPGEYLLRLWLRDAAGNQEERLAAPSMTLRYDDASPEVELEPLTADDPTRVTAKVSDRGSGLVSGAIEMRRVGATEWTALATTVDAERLIARIDDEGLGDGLFELRARAADHAGNERSTTTMKDGRTAQITLPLRLKTKLAVGVVKRSRRGEKLVSAARVSYGQLVRVRGRMTSPEGNPLQDLEVQAVSQVLDGVTPPRVIATVKTSRTGRFSFLVRKGPSRSITIRYAGAPQVRSVTRDLKLNVRSRTTIRPNRRSFVNGDTVRFRGAVTTGRIPGAGKLIEVQVLSRGKWRTFATTRTGKKGTWRHDYRFDGTNGRVTYRFRARVPRESGYPFVTGGSRSIRVRVRGL